MTNERFTSRRVLAKHHCKCAFGTVFKCCFAYSILSTSFRNARRRFDATLGSRRRQDSAAVRCAAGRARSAVGRRPRYHNRVLHHGRVLLYQPRRCDRWQRPVASVVTSHTSHLTTPTAHKLQTLNSTLWHALKTCLFSALLSLASVNLGLDLGGYSSGALYAAYTVSAATVAAYGACHVFLIFYTKPLLFSPCHSGSNAAHVCAPALTRYQRRFLLGLSVRWS